MSLLNTFRDLVEEFNISDSMVLDLDYRLGFVAAQVEEIKKILWREIVDYIIAEEMSKSDDDTVAMAGQTKKNEKRTNVRQFTKALRTYETLIAELEATKPKE